VISGKIKVNNIPRKKIEEQLDTFDSILKKENSYDYLLRMPIYNLTAEKVADIKKQIKDKKEELNYYTKATREDLWLVDLEEQFGKR
jgi:cystathionine beta-lyase/cystathionine gamma-synthase